MFLVICNHYSDILNLIHTLYSYDFHYIMSSISILKYILKLSIGFRNCFGNDSPNFPFNWLTFAV